MALAGGQEWAENEADFRKKYWYFRIFGVSAEAVGLSRNEIIKSFVIEQVNNTEILVYRVVWWLGEWPVEVVFRGAESGAGGGGRGSGRDGDIVYL